MSRDRRSKVLIQFDQKITEAKARVELETRRLDDLINLRHDFDTAGKNVAPLETVRPSRRRAPAVRPVLPPTEG
jgi:hypothetical protein